MCVCVYVCMCVCVSSWHSGRAEQMSACGYLCASCRRFLCIGLHVKPRLHAWHSHRQSRSHFAFSSLSDQWEIRLLFIFRNSFWYKITISSTMVIKRSPGGPCRWRAVNFEIHLWSSGMNADCNWRSICIQHVQIEAGLNTDPGNDSFWDKSVTLRRTETLHGTPSPQGMFTFSEMLALVESESSFGAYVSHRRPGGSLATSDLVGVCVCVYLCVSSWHSGWAEQMSACG